MGVHCAGQNCPLNGSSPQRSPTRHSQSQKSGSRWAWSPCCQTQQKLQAPRKANLDPTTMRLGLSLSQRVRRIRNPGEWTYVEAGLESDVCAVRSHSLQRKLASEHPRIVQVPASSSPYSPGTARPEGRGSHWPQGRRSRLPSRILKSVYSIFQNRKNSQLRQFWAGN